MMKLLQQISIFLILFLSVFNETAFSQTDTVLIDFGSTLSPLPWNNITSPSIGSVTDAMNSVGNSTGITISVNDAFNAVNLNGTTAPLKTLGFPVTATGDNFFGNGADFNGVTKPTAGLLISGLKPEKKYKLIFFASRTGGITDNREAYYRISGATTDTVFLNASENTSKVATYEIFPASDGTINIKMGASVHNTNVNKFFYLGAMKLVYDHQAPTGKQNLTLTWPVGGEFWQVGKKPSVIWDCKNLDQVIIQYSIDNGTNWQALDTLPAYQKKFVWTIPNNPSANCLVRLISDTLVRTSKNVFEISTDKTSCPLVVLGSSTAAGSGVSTLDSGWVYRFAKEIFQKNTRFTVTNLAVGGYTTFHVLPTGTPLPTGVTISPDPDHNITKAFTYKPYGIIVNMPSNDAGNNFGVPMQLINYQLLYSTAKRAGVKTWFTTTQPRNYSVASQIKIQKDVKDSILSKFGDYAIDFWNGFANTNGFILPEYDSGDGIHMNDRAHRILTERVIAKSFDTCSCNKIAVTKVTISGENITAGAVTTTMKFTVIPENASVKEVNWSVNNTAYATIDNQGVLTAKSKGAVIVKATSAEAGSTVFALLTIKIDITTGIESLTSLEDKTLNVFPNPVNNTGTVSYKVKNRGNIELNILDIMGRKIECLLSQEQNAGNYDFIWTIDTSKIKPGLYLLQFKQGNQQQLQKVFISN